MKFTIDRTPLQKALAHIASVVERRSAIPILENLVIDAGPDGLALTGTDMDLELIETVLDADIHVPGKTTAPAQILYDIARRLPDDRKVEIETADKARPEIMIRCGRSRFTVPTIDPEDYPVMSAGELPHRFALTAAALRTLIDRTRFAMETDGARPFLSGIYLHATKSNEAPVVRAVATDGHRLARFEMTAPEGAAGMPGIILPRNTVIELRKIIDAVDSDIDVALSEYKIRFTLPGIVLTSKLIDGTFPDYDRAIPADNNKMCEVLIDALTAAVERVQVIATDKARAVKLILTESGMTVSATSPTNGEAVDDIDCRWSGPDIEIGLNARYLLDNAAAISGETMRLTLADPITPVVVSDPDDTGALYVLMPMRF